MHKTCSSGRDGQEEEAEARKETRAMLLDPPSVVKEDERSAGSFNGLPLKPRITQKTISNNEISSAIL